MYSIQTNNAPKALGPYSQGFVCNGLLFVSGQIPIDPQTNALIEASITDQVEQIFKNIEAICSEANTNLNNICKLTIFLTNLNNFSKVNAVFAKRLQQPYPARETVEVAKLPLNAAIEISAIAKVDL